MIDPETIYNSVRQEVLDQKKCQFQMFGAAITASAAILAYASSMAAGPLVYVVPVLMNLLALTILLDKAVSIQRMVGYLQLMESEQEQRDWKWEYHLNRFRGIRGRRTTADHRKHTYIRNISLMLLLINALATALYFLGPEAQALRRSPSYQNLREIYGAVHLVVIGLNVGGLAVAGRRWWQLVYGEFTSSSVRERWLTAIEKG